VLVLLLTVGTWIGSRFRLGVVANIPCLPAKLYLYRLTSEEPVRGDQVVFRTDVRTLPQFQVGAVFVKQVEGLPGDEVEINTAGRVRITGSHGFVFESALEDGVLQILGRQRNDFTTRYRIPPGHYFVVGTLPHTFDSRYWGLVHRDQLMGKVVWVLSGYDPEDREKDIARLREARARLRR
jgi:conjugal transfer pilin signal peptidase TrbI